MFCCIFLNQESFFTQLSPFTSYLNKNYCYLNNGTFYMPMSKRKPFEGEICLDYQFLLTQVVAAGPCSSHHLLSYFVTSKGFASQICILLGNCSSLLLHVKFQGLPAATRLMLVGPGQHYWTLPALCATKREAFQINE